MLGIKDPWIYLAYILSFFSAILCIIYGAVNWNKGEEISENELKETEKWEKEELEIKNSL